MALGWDDRQIQPDALAALGLTPDAPPPEPERLEIWTDNVSTLNVFIRMMRQWSVGMAGPIGLRLEALPTALRLEGVPRTDWPEVADGVTVMEVETLRLWRERG